MPHLDHRRLRSVRCHVDGQVGVVDDDQPGGAQPDHAPEQPPEVAELAAPAVAVRLKQQDVVEVGIAGAHRGMEMGQVPLEHRDGGRGQHDPPA